MKNIEQFIEENKGKIFRYVVYNRHNIWTPKQIEGKYIDETMFEDTHYECCRITDVVNTPNGIMLELSRCDFDDYEDFGIKEYQLLNNIKLELFDYDNKGGNEYEI